MRCKCLNSIAICSIAQAIKESAGVGTAAHGLCFYLPVEMSTLLINEEKETQEKN